MWRKGSIVLVLLFFLGGTTWAQDTLHTSTTYSSTRTDQPHGGIGFGPILGIYKSSYGDAARLTGGAALRLKLSPAFAVEGAITYREDQYSGGTIKARTWPIQVTGLLYVLPVVYGAVGAGWYNTTLEVNTGSLLPGTSITGSETQQNFGWHFGGGLELPMGGMSLTGDIRYVFLNYDWKNLPGTNGTNANFFVITAGLLFGL